MQYIFRLKENLELLTIANSANIRLKKEVKPRDIELWHLRISYLDYRSLKALKNLSNGINFKGTTLSKLYGDCQKNSQTRQLLRSPMSQSTEFLGCVHNDLEGHFPQTRQGYWYNISFLGESKGFIDVKPFKLKDDALLTFKNYKALHEK